MGGNREILDLSIQFEMIEGYDPAHACLHDDIAVAWLCHSRRCHARPVYPGRPDRYYTIENGEVTEVYPTIPTPDRGNMLDVPFVVPFAQGSSVITNEAQAVLERAAQRALHSPWAEIYVTGNTDSVGEGDIRRAGNVQFASTLSTQRAVNVNKWLERRLGDRYPKRSFVTGVGFAIHVVVGGLPMDQRPNRRVDVRVVVPVGNNKYAK